MVDALVQCGDEGRGVAAISFGEVPSNLRSGDLRMGKPIVVNLRYLGFIPRGEPGEVKHLSTQRKRDQLHFVSSGERTRRSPNHFVFTQHGVVG